MTLKLTKHGQTPTAPFVTIDKNLSAQQKTAGLSFGVIVLQAPSNKLEDVKPLVPQILAVLLSLQPGQVVLVAQT